MPLPCPKPAPSPPKARKVLRAKRWGVSKNPPKALPKENPKQAAKRRVKARKHYASPEYKTARHDAVVRSGGQCEVRHLYNEDMRLATVLLPGEDPPFRINDDEKWFLVRCPMTTTLEFHETEYGSDIGLIRKIAGVICCQPDHHYIEATRHPTRKHGQGA